MEEDNKDEEEKNYYIVNYNGVDYKCYFDDVSYDSHHDIIPGWSIRTVEDKIEDLEFDLKECEESEDYEQCAIIRDKIIKLKINNELK